MRILVVVFATIVVVIGACGGGGGSSSTAGGSGGSSSNGADDDGNNCVLTSEVAEYDGERVILCGTVAATEYLPDQKRNTVLYMDAPPPGHSVTVVLEGAIRASFASPPEERFGPGETICADGDVSIVDGVPQVFVNNAQNIVFLEELVVTGVACTGAGTN